MKFPKESLHRANQLKLKVRRKTPPNPRSNKKPSQNFDKRRQSSSRTTQPSPNFASRPLHQTPHPDTRNFRRATSRRSSARRRREKPAQRFLKSAIRRRGASADKFGGAIKPPRRIDRTALKGGTGMLSVAANFPKSPREKTSPAPAASISVVISRGCSCAEQAARPRVLSCFLTRPRGRIIEFGPPRVRPLNAQFVWAGAEQRFARGRLMRR